MSFKWFALDDGLALNTQLSVPGLIIALICALILTLFWIRRRHDFAGLTMRQWAALAAIVVIAPFAALFASLTIQSYLFAPFNIMIYSVALLPLVVAAVWLGAGPAAFVGAVTGLAWAFTSSGRITQPLEVGLLGAAAGTLLNLAYRGNPARWLRQPLLAMVLSAVFVGWPLVLLGIFATNNGPGFVGLERTLQALIPSLVGMLITAGFAGLILQFVMMWRPRWRPIQEHELQTAPWDRHLSHRILFTLIPLTIVVILVLVGVVALASYRVATRLVVDQMARDAANAGSNIPFFTQVGRSLIHDLAAGSELTTADSDEVESILEERLRAVPFFQQLVYLDASQQTVGTYPPLSSEFTVSAVETEAIRIALEEGIPAEVTVYSEETSATASVSFLAPMLNPETGDPAGVLLGSTALDTNPILSPVVTVLESGFVGSGEGFIINEQNRILLYPAHPEREQEVFQLRPSSELSATGREGSAFRQREEAGTQTLVYIMPVQGQSGWSVVVTVPDEVVLTLAAQIALPMLLLLLTLAAAAFPLTVVVMRRITDPLGQLLTAADALGQGDLGRPVEVAGEDEIGRLGEAFEQMRVRLRDRLDELERLLRVSRSVASSLELFRAMPPILNSALEVTNALGVRVVVRQGGSQPVQSYASGEAAAVMASLDEQLLELVERQGTVVISQLWRASGSLDTTALPSRVQALMALPLRSDTSFHGVFWLAYDHEHSFEQAEMTFLSTLAGQAAVAIANARLFGEAQEERRKLEAVLESTADAMIVADNQGCIALLNPAAEKQLGLRAEEVRGRPAEQVIELQEMARLLTSLQEPVSVLEIPGPRGKTLLASVSTIVGHDGSITGRVAVMRDITALKELDNIKTVFLRIVSHDLRSPLTYMRGYLSMLPLTGELNDRQQEAIEKVTHGIDSISLLSERLLYLSRLQFGDEAQLELSMVDVETLINEVLAEQENSARQRNVSIKLVAEDRLPLLAADKMLYRQAVANLINNAVKYTPEGGEVTIRAAQVRDNNATQITVSVTDNGIGIREEDQPRLFEAFFRVPQREGEPPRPRGSGLGLALVKAIATAHGGSVGVDSEFGGGSTFHISVPVRKVDEL